MPTTEQDSLIGEEIASAEEFILEEKTSAKQPGRSFKFTLPLFPSLLILAALVLFSLSLIRFPDVAAAFAPDPPLRGGLFLTDKATNQCLRNLWHISRLRQEGKSIPKTLTCPASGAPYVVRIDSVACPNPQAHKLTLLHVTAENPIPEVR